MSIYKEEYVIARDPADCDDCGACDFRCPFEANYESDKGVGIDVEKCYGCGVCRHVCAKNALFLIPRNEHPTAKGNY